LSEHLGHEKGNPAGKGKGTGDSRNRYSDKTVLTENAEFDIAVPRDPIGSSRR
jgi:transposase-like protein